MRENAVYLLLRGGLAQLLIVVSMVCAHGADESVPYAPAIIFRSVDWWGPGPSGAMEWYAGKNQTPYPADLGRIKEARLIGKQQIEWLGREFDIDSVVRTEAGNFIVKFDAWRLELGKTHENRWLVDVFPPDKRFVTARFRTITKATAHLDGQK